MTAPLGSSELRRAILSALESLRARRDEIDEANVYPVPDGDTGTNLTLTMAGVAEAIAGVDHDPKRVAQAVVDGALNGARGNSGVILAQILRGIFGEVESTGATPSDIARGMQQAAELAYEAVLRPVEGTMLSVMRAAAEAVAEPDGRGVAEVFMVAAAAARDALAKTPEQLPVLKTAGVLDAGGMGLCLVLDAFASTLSGKAIPAPMPVGRPRVRPRESGSSSYGFEVQYMIESSDDRVPALRTRLGTLGDSVVVVGGNGLWRVHVHTNEVDGAIQAGREAGNPRGIEVNVLTERTGPVQGRSIPLAVAGAPVTVVAVVCGEGLRALFEDLGLGVAVEGGATMNPSVGELARAVDGAPTEDVILLPNDENIAAAALQAARVSAKNVEVVPTADPGQGLAAMFAFSVSADLGRNVAEMRRTLERTRTARVVIAVRDAQTPAGPVHAGQAMGLFGDEPAIVGDDPVEVCAALLVRMAEADGEPEAVTVVVGAGVPPEEIERLDAALETRLPHPSVEVHRGGQPVERFLLLVE